jgi:hypothetical protein
VVSWFNAVPSFIFVTAAAAIPTELIGLYGTEAEWITVIAMAVIASFGRWVSVSKRKGAGRAAAVSGLIAFGLGAFLIGSGVGNFWIRLGAAVIIALLERQAAMSILTRAGGVAGLPITAPQNEDDVGA